MTTLTERIEAQIAALQEESLRIQQQALRDVAHVDEKIAALKAAKAALTPAVERSYAQLSAMGLFRER